MLLSQYDVCIGVHLCLAWRANLSGLFEESLYRCPEGGGFLERYCPSAWMSSSLRDCLSIGQASHLASACPPDKLLA